MPKFVIMVREGRASMTQFFANSGQDLRFALRHLRANPGFTLVVVAVLTLGIGSSAAVFNVLYQVLLKPLPYHESGSLFFVHNRFPKSQVAVAGVSGFDYAEIAQRKDVFVNAGLFYYNDLIMTGTGEAKHVDAVNASATLFETLDMTPELGRTFNQTEDQRGAPGTVVLSDQLWRTTFGGDRGVLGRQIYLAGEPHTIIGVMPANFQFPSRETQLWIPIALRPNEFTLQGGRLEKWLHMIVRLAPGVTTQAADSALRSIAAQLGGRYPPFYPTSEGWTFTLRQVGDEQTANMRRWILLAFGAVLAVLLIACINVTGLLLVRNAARAGEIAIRTAMGASASRIVAQLMTESGALVLVSCGLGLVFCAWELHAIDVYGPLSQPVPFRARTIAFAVLLTILTTVLAGLLPALFGARVSVEQTLRSGASRTSTRGTGIRSVIVAAQVGCAVTLVFIATQLTTSFLNLSRVPAGFQEQHVWTGSINLPSWKYKDRQSWDTQLYKPLLEVLNAIPGVQVASGTNALPFNPSGVWTEEIHFPHRPQMTPRPEAQIAVVFPSYFKAMGIPILRWATIPDADFGARESVAIIDAELARRYFPSEDPLSKFIASGGAKPARIVGVVGSVQNSDLGGPREPEVYFPEFQERVDAMYLVLRMNGDVDPTASVRSAIEKIDPDVALYDTAFMADRVAASLRLRRCVAYLLDGLAGTGLFLALVGLYGSVAHFVELRRREIGIRAALGASRSELVGMVILQAGTIVGTGLVAGAAAAVLGGQALRNQLFGVSPAAASTWTIVLGLTLIATLLAAFVPAWRAGRIEPAVALRNE
ncbi:MAG TPA: ABC transporter permease [Bryobacteraceae bacterium]|nr:ABC transporter permease [Bryobacteraceae bacterium]